MEDNETQERVGVDRRTLIRRSAVMGGAMVWAVPTVQTLAGPAFAAGSPQCQAVLITITNPTNPKKKKCLTTTFAPSNACCNCLNSNGGGTGAIATCTGNGSCMVTGTSTVCP